MVFMPVLYLSSTVSRSLPEKIRKPVVRLEDNRQVGKHGAFETGDSRRVDAPRAGLGHTGCVL